MSELTLSVQTSHKDIDVTEVAWANEDEEFFRLADREMVSESMASMAARRLDRSSLA